MAAALAGSGLPANRLEREITERPHARVAQRRLAREITTLVHGSDHAAAVELAADALFGRGELSGLDEGTLRAALTEAALVTVGPGTARGIVDLLVATGLVDSRSAARRAVGEGSVSVNNTKVTDESWLASTSAALHGRLLVVRRGRRHMAGVELVEG